MSVSPYSFGYLLKKTMCIAYLYQYVGIYCKWQKWGNKNVNKILFAGSLEAHYQPEASQKPEAQAAGLNFVKFATKVANLSKLSQTKSPTSPTTSDNKMEF